MDRTAYGDDVSTEYPDVMLSIERVTPEVAANMLKHNTDNRPLNGDKVKQYAYDMTHDRWVLNGQALGFDADDVLVNGQHRLAACVRANVPFDTLVVRGLGEGAWRTTDTGEKRTLSQYLKKEGWSSCADCAALVTKLMILSRNGLNAVASGNSTNRGFTLIDLMDFADAHRKKVQAAVRDSKRIGIEPMNRGLAAFFYYVFRFVSVDDASFFFWDFQNEQPSRQPVRKLKETLARNRLRPAENRITKKQEFVYIVNAWNAYRNDDNVSEFRFSAGGAARQQVPAIDGFTEDMRGLVEGDRK